MEHNRKPYRWTAVALLCLTAAPPGLAQSEPAPAGLDHGFGQATPSRSAAARAVEEAAGLLAALADPDARNWQEAERDLVRLWSRSGSDTADLLLQRGRDAVEDEDLAAALEHLTALTDHFPDFAEGWNARATVYFQQEKYGLAVQDAARAVTLNPNHFGALAGLGMMFERMGDDASALAAFSRAMEINPHRERVQDALERVRRKLGIATL